MSDSAWVRWDIHRKALDELAEARAQLEAAREEHSETWVFLKQARQERDTALDASYTAQAQVGRLREAAKSALEWLQYFTDEESHAAGDCLGDPCERARLDDDEEPGVECTCQVKIISDLRAALAPAVVPTGPEVQQGEGEGVGVKAFLDFYHPAEKPMGGW